MQSRTGHVLRLDDTGIFLNTGSSTTVKFCKTPAAYRNSLGILMSGFGRLQARCWHHYCLLTINAAAKHIVRLAVVGCSA